MKHEDAGSLLRYRLAVVAAGVLWSLSGLFIKSLSADPALAPGALCITFHRSLFAALCLAPFLRGRRRPRLRDAAGAIVVYTLLLGLFVAATQGTTAANAIFLQYTAPIYALILGRWLFHDPVRRPDVIAMLVAMVGIAILFLGSFRGGERWALLMGAGSGAMFGFFLLQLRRLRYADPIAVTAMNNAGVALLCGLALAAVRPEEALLVPRALFGEPRLLPAAAALALMGCVQIAIPYALFSYGLRRVPALEGSLLSLIEPLLNPLWVALFVGEVPNAATLIGGALILVALAARYTLLRETPRAAEAEGRAA